MPGSGRARRQYDKYPDDENVTLDKICLAGCRGEDAQSLGLCYSELSLVPFREVIPVAPSLLWGASGRFCSFFPCASSLWPGSSSSCPRVRLAFPGKGGRRHFEFHLGEFSRHIGEDTHLKIFLPLSIALCFFCRFDFFLSGPFPEKQMEQSEETYDNLNGHCTLSWNY